ncbi:Zn-dependent protease with chaperone function [Microbulbifer sp. A4B17]|uniref:M48 family metallopeptidase n=1 Tax=Microbulbifer sp. A4B17 TaxID=359370 RepID=UPI000D52DE46|nr:M48 family metallopeptidase [Microbulbifer sp. A4B17]AWF82387.1 Zn-dependent protease with chaperone function [Microbulbifer sp. A4B17]
MNFYVHQDKAKQSSRLLVFLFSLALITLIALSTLATAAMVSLSRGQPFLPSEVVQVLGWETLAPIAFAIAIIVALGSLYKFHQLSPGGKAVAESLGGHKLNIAARSDREKRALNIVEEMAIAAGIPVPDVYIIEDGAINAFAAGQNPTDAVIGLTRGSLEKLTREELQGVVAHEFSHILNGDIRLNTQITGLLHGILIIGLLGQLLVRSPAPHKRVTPLRFPLLGLGIILITLGYIGTLTGNLIKAAVNRQREFLADASAVQFTRNNLGIANALKKIGGHSSGSELSSPSTAEFNHMLFAVGVKRSLLSLFATHPPLAVRIKRLEPTWSGHFANSEKQAYSEMQTAISQDPKNAQLAMVAPTTPFQVALDAIDNSITKPDTHQVEFGHQLLESIPILIQQAAHEPFTARALVYFLLLHKEKIERNKQLQLLEKIAHPAVIREMQRLKPHMESMPGSARLVLIDLCIPALRALVPQQYQVFKRNLIKLLHSDGKVEVWEWALYRVLMHALDGAPDQQRLSSNKNANKDASRFIIAAIAHAGNSQYLPAKRAYEKGLTALGLEITPLPGIADITLPRLDKAIAIASLIPPLEKPNLLKAIVTTLNHNGVIKAEEIELLRAVADSLDCPMPPIINKTY